MTALPLPQERPEPRLLTADEFAALPEESEAIYELQEGRIVMSPRARPDHQDVLAELTTSLRAQTPGDLKALPEIDVDLRLVDGDQPGFVRVPDLAVVRREALGRVRAEGGIVRADEVVLAVEIVSPTSRRTDGVVKRGEYADAGIPYYWIVDISGGVSLTASHLAGEFGYVDDAPVRGTCEPAGPFPVRLDLDALL